MIAKNFKRVIYLDLNNKQKENYNFHRLASLLATFGFNCLWLNDDVKGADLLALSKEGDVYKVQLKGRISFDKKYIGKEIYIACPIDDGYYIYFHDEALELFVDRFNNTKSWMDRGSYSTTTKYGYMETYFLNEESEYATFHSTLLS
jgi:hypothetical protein